MDRLRAYMHWCPGCEAPHGIWVESPNPTTGARWTWDGNIEVPSFAPSVLVFTEENGVRKTLCHYFVRGGMIEFCGDSVHALAGKTVPLPDFERAVEPIPEAGKRRKPRRGAKSKPAPRRKPKGG